MRVVPAQLKVEFELAKDEFESEFNSSHNGLDEWLSLLRAKEESENSDPLTLKLLAEVLRKLENIENLLNNDGKKNTLANVKEVNNIGYEGFCFDEKCLQSGQEYFARVQIQGFVKKNIKLFFKALDEMTAKISKISKFDEKEWAQNVARAEIGAIRAKKGEK